MLRASPRVRLGVETPKRSIVSPFPRGPIERKNKHMAGMDAISMLKDDHKAVEQLFKRFEKAGDRAHVEKRDIVDRIIEALSRHAAIEEQLFYPGARATVPDTEDLVLESLEEHHIVKWVLSELDSMSPEDERFDAKVTVLIENVRHHVKEEEQELFPMVRNELGRNSLSDLGEAMAAAKQVAPTHPHPRSPDTPPANLVVGTKAGVADRILDTVNGLAQGYVIAVGDVIAVMLGRKRPGVSPTGSKASRTTARQVRSASSDATEAAIEKYLSIPKQSAAFISLPAFPLSVDPVRLQRVSVQPESRELTRREQPVQELLQAAREPRQPIALRPSPC